MRISTPLFAARRKAESILSSTIRYQVLLELRKHGLREEERSEVLAGYDLDKIPENMRDPEKVAWHALCQYAIDSVTPSAAFDEKAQKFYNSVKKKMMADFAIGEQQAERLLVLGHLREQLEKYPQMVEDQTERQIALELMKEVAWLKAEWEVDDKKLIAALEAGLLDGNI